MKPQIVKKHMFMLHMLVYLISELHVPLTISPMIFESEL